jgi:hypothetical protein
VTGDCIRCEITLVKRNVLDKMNAIPIM